MSTDSELAASAELGGLGDGADDLFPLEEEQEPAGDQMGGLDIDGNYVDEYAPSAPDGGVSGLGDNVYTGAHPALIIGDEVDDAVVFSQTPEILHPPGPRSLDLARHEGGTPGAFGVDFACDDDVLGTGDGLRKDSAGIVE